MGLSPTRPALNIDYLGAPAQDALPREREAYITNKELFESAWRPMRSFLKRQWGALTDRDLDVVGGDYEQLMALLQATYGFTRGRAEAEFGRRAALLRDQRVEAELARRLAKIAARHERALAAMPFGPGGRC